MNAALCDTNVVVKWFYDEPGNETTAARRIALASADGLVVLKVLDLTYYETGNVLARSGEPPAVVAGVLEQLHAICGPGVALERNRWAAVAGVATREGLSFYDAAYVAVAAEHQFALITADKAILSAGGVLPSAYAGTLGVA